MTGRRNRDIPRDSRGRVIDQREAANRRQALLESLVAAVSGNAPIAERPRGVPAGARGDETIEVGVYMISVAAKLTELHPQTLRKYERIGLLSPSRSDGSLRLYSEEDVARLRLIRNLIEKFGLNLAGVRLVMDIVSHLKHVLGGLESNGEILRIPEGRAAVNELAGLLDALENG